MSLGVYVVLASVSPLFAACIPLFISKLKKELPIWVPFGLLGLSSGMLFAVATLDLIPEGIGMALNEANEEWNPNFVVESESDLDDHHHDHEPASFTIFSVDISFINIRITTFHSQKQM